MIPARARILVCAAGAALAALAPGPLAARPLRELCRISVNEGVIGDGFALDERGARLAYLVTDGKGNPRLQVGPSGGGAARGRGADLTRFSSTPERVVSVGAGWFVIANDGRRRAIAVAPNGALGREIGTFSDGFVAAAPGPVFVAVTDRGEHQGGHGYDIAAFRPGGVALGRKTVTLGADGTITGSQGLIFLAFTDGYLRALVRKPGRYQARADTRGGQEIASYDVLHGTLSGAHPLGALARVSDLVAKRNEKPGLETFVRLDDQASGLDLIGPGEKLRPLALPAPLARYDVASLEQQQNGGRLTLALVLDPLGAAAEGEGRRPARALHLFEVAAASARATLIGEIPLPDDKQPYVWAAGGDRVAFMRKTGGSGGMEIIVYGR